MHGIELIFKLGTYSTKCNTENTVKALKNETLDLVEGFKQNDRRCLNKIYSMHYSSVEHYIFKNNGSEADAKDIFQEAILAAWLNVKEGKFSPETSDSLGGYIFQISKFKWLDKLKSKAYKSTMRIEREETIDDGEDEINEKQVQEDRINYLKSLYSKLDEKCKQILNGFYYEKKSLEEIGAELSYDAGSLKTMKYRCMKKLKAAHSSNQAQ